jgi:2-deoxystreptamine N-acetyl-D-glucosaminyltransferase/2-deoxystreptamine glucosyltransferase
VRILRLTPHYYFETAYWPPRFDPLGGMQVQITTLSEWLAEQGVEQDILTTGFPGLPRVIKPRPNLRLHSVRFGTLPFRSPYTGTLLLDDSWALGVVRWLARTAPPGKGGLGSRYDLIHVHASGVAWPLRIARYAQRELGLPLVLSVHCSRVFTYQPMNRFDALIHPRVQKLETEVVAGSDRVLFLTERMRVNYEAFLPGYRGFAVAGDCVAPHHLLYNGDADGESQTLLAALGIPPTSTVALYVGRVAHEKGWQTFVDMAGRLRDRPDLHFLVAGDGPRRREMEAAAGRAGLGGRFHVTGFVSHRMVPAIMRRARLLVIPSLHEELGGTALEGIAAGVPVIASAVGGLAGILTDERTALLRRPRDDEGFAEAARRLLDDPEEARRLTARARLEILPRFTPARVLPLVKRLYEEVLAEQTGGQGW